MQLPLLGPGLFAAAGDIEHELEQLPANVFDAGFAAGNATGIDIHEVMPAPRQIIAGSDLDNWYRSQSIRRTASSGKHVQVHAGSQLQGAADKITGRRGGINQAFCLSLSPGASTPEIGLLPDLTIDPMAFSTILARPPFLLPGVVLALRSTPPRLR